MFYRNEAGIKMDGRFVQRLIYEDSLTYDLVAAASKVLGKRVNMSFYSRYKNIQIYTHRGLESCLTHDKDNRWGEVSPPS